MSSWSPTFHITTGADTEARREELVSAQAGLGSETQDDQLNAGELSARVNWLAQWASAGLDVA